MIPYGVFADPIAKTPSGIVQTTSLLPTVILPSLGGVSSSVGPEAYSQNIQSSDTVTADIEASIPIPSKLTGYPYTIVDTGQTICYDTIRQISTPKMGESYYGQDAQYVGNQPSFTISYDGLTIYDKNTGLTWQLSPDTNGDGTLTSSDKLTWVNAQLRPVALNAAKYGGYSDWRLPTIKELYSLIDFKGTDPKPDSTSALGLIPFINASYFKFTYGQTSAGERIIDSQYASSTLYVSKDGNGIQLLFGVNFADGRIKGYGLNMPGSNSAKTFFVQCVRGNTNYGKNAFVSNSDGTITDQATGLMWSQADSGTSMDWKDALSWVQTKNTANYLGHRDWRLPNAKELQSIVDYTRSPDTTNSAAIDQFFTCTRITNEAGKTDYPYFWTGTTHANSDGSGNAGVYIAFGRAMGYMNGQWQDVHGAGAQRSDPKVGDASDYPYGRGPQGDSIRIKNYVRLVRDVSSSPVPTLTPTASPTKPPAPTPTITRTPTPTPVLSPVISSITPPFGARGTTVPFTLTGKNFGATAQISLQRKGTIIPAGSVLIQNPTLMKGSFTIPANTEIEQWTVIVKQATLTSNTNVLFGIHPGAGSLPTPQPESQPNRISELLVQTPQVSGLKGSPDVIGNPSDKNPLVYES